MTVSSRSSRGIGGLGGKEESDAINLVPCKWNAKTICFFRLLDKGSLPVAVRVVGNF